MVGPAFVAQQLPGEDDVLDGDRFAVGEFGRGIDVEGHVAALRIGLDRAGDQAVKRERLVIAARHQALDHVAADRRRGDSFDDERIEAVECAEHALHQAAALGRGRIGIGQAGETRGQCRLAMHGDGVSGLGDLRPGGGVAENSRAEQHGAPGRGPAQCGATEGTTEGGKRGHGDNTTRRLEVMSGTSNEWGHVSYHIARVPRTRSSRVSVPQVLALITSSIFSNGPTSPFSAVSPASLASVRRSRGVSAVIGGLLLVSTAMPRNNRSCRMRSQPMIMCTRAQRCVDAPHCDAQFGRGTLAL